MEKEINVADSDNMSNLRLLIINAVGVVLMAFVVFLIFSLPEFFPREKSFYIKSVFMPSLCGGMIGYLLAEEVFKRRILLVAVFSFVVFAFFINFFFFSFNIKILFVEVFFSSFSLVFMYIKTKIKNNDIKKLDK